MTIRTILAVATCLAPLTAQSVPLADFIRVRCSQDGAETFTQWRGKAYAQPENQPQKEVFELLGMNVARCLANADGTWSLMSRELQLYLDPATHKVLHRWTNPWTSEEVPVVHVANNPVQNRLPDTPYEPVIDNGIATFSQDVPLTYPNALASDPRFADYSAQPMYQAVEMFKFHLPVEEFERNRAASLGQVALSWTRIGPWLPWMKMKGIRGGLIYSVSGTKLARFEDLDARLQEEILTRVPAYRHAPGCWLATRNQTSWSYFAKNFDAYLRGERFPLPAPVEQDVCAQ